VYFFDDSRRPLVIAHFSGPIDLAEVARFKADIEDLVDRESPHALVYDFAQAEIPPREVVMDVLHWTREIRFRHKTLYEERPEPIPTFTAFHMPGRIGALLRFFEQMIPGIRNQQGYFEDLESALLASERALESFGLEVPPQVARRCGS